MLTIKMIQVDDSFKALILDLNKDEGKRLVHMTEGPDYDLVEALAEDWVNDNGGLRDVTWH